MCKGLALVFIFSISTLAQVSADTLYAKGLKACLEKEVESYSKFSSRDLRNVTVVREDKLTRDLPSQFGEIRVEYLSVDELALKFKSRLIEKDERKELPVIEVFPIYDKGGKLFFAYSNYWFSYSEKRQPFYAKKANFWFCFRGRLPCRNRF